MEKIQIAKPYIPSDDIDEIVKNIRLILESGMLMQGQWVEKFENEFAAAMGVKFARAVNAGTSALQAILEYYDVRGKEVIVPVNTFLASANAVVLAGGIPVFVDIDPRTLLVDVDQLKTKRTEKTKGVIVVHLDGYIIPRMSEIREWCRAHDLFLIEDAAHAAGSRSAEGNAGALSDAGAFSMLATKVITSGGEGGMVTTNNKELAHRVTSLRFHGEDSTRGIQNRIGYSWRMTELQAVVGYFQIKRLEEIVSRRMGVAQAYDKAFVGVSCLSVYKTSPGYRNGYYKYPLRLLPPLNRLDVKKKLEESFGIKTGTSYWPPCHLQPAYRAAFSYKEGDFPIAEEVLNQTISLPMYCGLTPEEIGRVVTGVLAVCG